MKKTLKIVGMILLAILLLYMLISVTISLFVPSDNRIIFYDKDGNVIGNYSCKIGTFYSDCEIAIPLTIESG